MQATSVSFAGLLFMLSMNASAATLNECKQADGTTVLLWEKCPDLPSTPPTSVPKVMPSPGAASKPATTTSSPKAATKPRSEPAPNEVSAPTGPPFATPAVRQLDREMVVEIISGYTVCSDDVDGFRPKYSAAFDYWKLRNSAAIARAQTNPATRKEIAERIAEGRSASGGTDPEKRNYCEKLIGPFLTGKFADM
jgi:pyruvate/2-oxoglutarate dehydrogenase complex dihydrolipoamide acyltransferase (E2) component